MGEKTARVSRQGGCKKISSPPELSTLKMCNGLYETILGIEIDRRNFRRKILDSGYIVATGEEREGLQNRHPDLYKFNKKLKPNQFNINIDLT